MTLKKPPLGPPKRSCSSAISRSMLMRDCLRRRARRWRIRDVELDDDELELLETVVVKLPGTEEVVDDGDRVVESVCW